MAANNIPAMRYNLDEIRNNREKYLNYIHLAKKMSEEAPQIFDFLNTWWEDTPGMTFEDKINKMKKDEHSEFMIFWTFLTHIADKKHTKEINKILFPNIYTKKTGKGKKN
jgi:hypothetical protein